jgi:hypothetical protein
VSNAADSIKAACDFVDTRNLKETCRVADELRLQRLCSGHGQDVLQLFSTLYYSVIALRAFQSTLSAGEAANTHSMPDDECSSSMEIEEGSSLMDIDGLPATVSFAPGHGLNTPDSSEPEDDVGLTANHSPSNGPMTPHPKTLRKREKNRMGRLKKAMAARSYQGPEFHFHCELCPRKFTRSGLVDHL